MDKTYNFLSKYSLIIVMLVSTLSFILFFPSRYINIDEHDYFNNAGLLLNGELKHDCSLNVPGQWEANGYCISKYNIGTSFFLIPAAIFHSEQLGFITTFIFYLISILIFYNLLKEFRINPIFLYLYAFYLPLIYFSRTLFSEIYSVTFIMLAFYFIHKLAGKGKHVHAILAGISIGAAIFIRYTNIIPIIALCLGIFIQEVSVGAKSKKLNNIFIAFVSVIKKYASLILTSISMILLLMLFNNYYYDSPLRSGYYYAFEEGVLVLSQLLWIPAIYFLLLNIMYPGMLLLSLKSTIKYKWQIILTFLSSIIFYTLVRNLSFGRKLSDIIFGTRYVLPILPLVFLLYFDYLNSRLDKKYMRWVMVVTVMLLVIIDIVINVLHYKYLMNKL